ncbi:hypothetical protein BaRGS_00008153 [Batillaria attramentaria]|uniref:Uncharacterized protein n=1 Tax=Batillaria attramentaria TaxID=370345 RepID=A0ABD0LN04_9CAEN
MLLTLKVSNGPPGRGRKLCGAVDPIILQLSTNRANWSGALAGTFHAAPTPDEGRGCRKMRALPLITCPTIRVGPATAGTPADAIVSHLPVDGHKMPSPRAAGC